MAMFRLGYSSDTSCPEFLACFSRSVPISSDSRIFLAIFRSNLVGYVAFVSTINGRVMSANKLHKFLGRVTVVSCATTVLRFTRFGGFGAPRNLDFVVVVLLLGNRLGSSKYLRCSGTFARSPGKKLFGNKVRNLGKIRGESLNASRWGWSPFLKPACHVIPVTTRPVICYQSVFLLQRSRGVPHSMQPYPSWWNYTGVRFFRHTVPEMGPGSRKAEVNTELKLQVTENREKERRSIGRKLKIDVLTLLVSGTFTSAERFKSCLLG